LALACAISIGLSIYVHNTTYSIAAGPEKTLECRLDGLVFCSVLFSLVHLTMLGALLAKNKNGLRFFVSLWIAFLISIVVGSLLIAIALMICTAAPLGAIIAFLGFWEFLRDLAEAYSFIGLFFFLLGLILVKTRVKTRRGVIIMYIITLALTLIVAWPLAIRPGELELGRVWGNEEVWRIIEVHASPLYPLAAVLSLLQPIVAVPLTPLVLRVYYHWRRYRLSLRLVSLVSLVGCMEVGELAKRLGITEQEVVELVRRMMRSRRYPWPPRKA